MLSEDDLFGLRPLYNDTIARSAISYAINEVRTKAKCIDDYAQILNKLEDIIQQKCDAINDIKFKCKELEEKLKQKYMQTYSKELLQLKELLAMEQLKNNALVETLKNYKEVKHGQGRT